MLRPLPAFVQQARMSTVFIFLIHLLLFYQTQAFSATPYGQAGPAAVDLNQYNLKSLSEIEQQWTAVTVTQNQQQQEKIGKVYLSSKDTRQVYVDTVTVSFPRVPGQGLGLELIELAGGRTDNVGITIVSNITSNGPAATATEKILPGDSIAQVTILRERDSTRSSFQQTEQQFKIATECLSYDATVEALQTLPVCEPDKDYSDTVVLQLKRLRYKPKVTVKLQFPPDENGQNTQDDMVIEMFAGENLRYGMLLRDVPLNDPLAKRFDTKNGGNCGANGLCRTCIVSVVNGKELLNPQRPAEKQMFVNENPRYRLSCKAIVGFGMQEGNMTVRVHPGQW